MGDSIEETVQPLHGSSEYKYWTVQQIVNKRNNWELLVNNQTILFNDQRTIGDHKICIKLPLSLGGLLTISISLSKEKPPSGPVYTYD